MMCQAGIFNNCNGSCDFCLIKDDRFYSMEEIYTEIDRIKENIKFIATQEENWTNKFSNGISLLGGELYYINDEKYKKKFLELIDVIIDEILLKSPNPDVRYSTVSNGYYDPENLLFPVVDRIAERVGIRHVDMNFSYDLLYRFKNEAHERRVRSTINAFAERYNYQVGVQMILTQNVINKMVNEGWTPTKFIQEKFPKCRLAFLYPHPIYRGNNYTGAQNLPLFNFDRKSFFKAMSILKEKEPFVYEAFKASTKNSATFKYTMLYVKKEAGTTDQKPILSDGKEVINPKCGHSVLYQCYSDCDRCMLCDIEGLE